MSRLIKFRVWDRELETMYYPPGIHTNSHISDCFVDVVFDGDKNKRFDYLQHTGFHDSESNMIYEGDYLYFPEANQYLDVFWQDGAFRVLFSRDDEAIVLTEKLLKANPGTKVAGNIYEHEHVKRY